MFCCLLLQAQSEIFISNANQEISIVNIDGDGCTQDIQVNTTNSLSDITLHPNGRMYGVSFSQRKVYEVNMSTGALTEIVEISEADKLVGLTADANGTLYVTEGNVVPSDLYTVNPISGSYVNKGPLADGSAGDLTWSFGKLYNASDNNKLVEVNIEDPASSIVIGTFNGIVKPGDKMFALVTVFVSCVETVTYGLSVQGDYYEIDLETANVTRLCIGTVDLYGATSEDEFLASECTVALDLDANNNSGVAGSDFLNVFDCPTATAAIADDDVEILASVLVDSLRIGLVGSIPDGADEFLESGAFPGITSSPDGQQISAVNTGNVSQDALEDYLRSMRYRNVSIPSTTGTRTVEVIAFSEGNSDTAMAFISLAEVDAGEDAAIEICVSTDTTQLINVLGGDPAPGGVWMPPLASGTSLFNPSTDAEGTYAYIVSDGCDIDTAYVEVSVFANGIDLIRDTTVCQSDSLVLDADIGLAGALYQWNTNETTSSITINSTGIYIVTVEVEGCIISDEMIANFDDLPLDIGPDTVVCEGQRVRLDANVGEPGATYAWSTGQTTPIITVDPGTYQVVVTSGDCVATDEITISEITNAVDLGNDTSICSGGSLVLDADIGIVDATYLWNTGATTTSIIAASSGEYSVTVDIAGCSNSDTIQISLHDIAVDLGDDFSLCPGDDALLNADTGEPGTSYLWNTGAISSGLLVNSGGTYSVVATLDGCTAEDSVTVSVVTGGIIPVDLGPDQTICNGQSVTLSSGFTTAVYNHSWNTGSTNASITTSSAGVYTVTLSNSCQTGTDAIEIFTMDCDTTGTVDTTIIPPLPYEPFCDILMPSAFTPNGDNHNDVFGPLNPCPDVTYYLFRIYNRYGELLFEGDLNHRWDGTYKGKPVLMDSYIWYLEWTESRRGFRQEEGSVIVIR